MQATCEPQDGHDGAPIQLADLCWVFLRIACTGFGGFMAMISVMQNVVVERRKLLGDDDVLDGLSLASVLPGPIAINAAAYVGYRLRGTVGAAVCVCAAVLPSFLLMVLLSAAYFRWGEASAISKMFMGMMPAVVAVIAAAGWRMRRTSITTLREGALAIGAAVAVLGIAEIYVTFAVMAAAAVAGRIWFGECERDRAVLTQGRSIAAKYPILYINANLLFLGALPAMATPLPHLGTGALLKLFGAFSGMSMLMFGGGYVFIPLLQHTVVEGYGWVTRQEFIDAISLGQVMPGPVMISAAFIGYKAAGITGAAVATVGMFAPPAVLMVLCARMLAGAKASVNIQAALRGVRAAATGMVFASAVLIGRSAEPHWTSVAVFAVSLIALMRYRIEAIWIVPVAGAAGLFLY